MTTLAVRFDQELSVAHRISGRLPCPQAVVVTTDRGTSGNQRTVVPCSLPWGHEPPCLWMPQRAKAGRTVCGLDLDALPFVLAPSGLAACPECFSVDRPGEYVEEAMFA